eukprot:CAMPEP_0197654624 /NCGR_PEP_ID=MMETSP1338-20131121/38964_1 /TAXON_ID=43686 ORGANISM="Pelagodinium beii, Strain RCC1491" /NCGR_SAMPLE_ID=MMETSP1338 /ASSEMBLY_ACC=CAM_ASM_000754 /LENGTH=184 /DNA_ID=CAMNT_0043230105 /DNA_START=31 /DNA_END=585 /DNA_ORIENTATION=-
MTINSNRIYNETVWREQEHDFKVHFLSEKGMTFFRPEEQYLYPMPARSPKNLDLPDLLGPSGPPDETALLQAALLPENKEAPQVQPFVSGPAFPEGLSEKTMPKAGKKESTQALARSLGLTMSSTGSLRRTKAKPDRCPPMEQFYDFSRMYQRPKPATLKRPSSQGHLSKVTKYPLDESLRFNK